MARRITTYEKNLLLLQKWLIKVAAEKKSSQKSNTSDPTFRVRFDESNPAHVDYELSYEKESKSKNPVASVRNVLKENQLAENKTSKNSCKSYTFDKNFSLKGCNVEKNSVKVHKHGFPAIKINFSRRDFACTNNKVVCSKCDGNDIMNHDPRIDNTYYKNLLLQNSRCLACFMPIVENQAVLISDTTKKPVDPTLCKDLNMGQISTTSILKSSLDNSKNVSAMEFSAIKSISDSISTPESVVFSLVKSTTCLDNLPNKPHVHENEVIKDDLNQMLIKSNSYSDVELPSISSSLVTCCAVSAKDDGCNTILATSKESPTCSISNIDKVTCHKYTSSVTTVTSTSNSFSSNTPSKHSLDSTRQPEISCVTYQSFGSSNCETSLIYSNSSQSVLFSTVSHKNEQDLYVNSVSTSSISKVPSLNECFSKLSEEGDHENQIATNVSDTSTAVSNSIQQFSDSKSPSSELNEPKVTCSPVKIIAPTTKDNCHVKSNSKCFVSSGHSLVDTSVDTRIQKQNFLKVSKKAITETSMEKDKNLFQMFSSDHHSAEPIIDWFHDDLPTLNTKKTNKKRNFSFLRHDDDNLLDSSGANQTNNTSSILKKRLCNNQFNSKISHSNASANHNKILDCNLQELSNNSSSIKSCRNNFNAADRSLVSVNKKKTFKLNRKPANVLENNFKKSKSTKKKFRNSKNSSRHQKRISLNQRNKKNCLLNKSKTQFVHNNVLYDWPFSCPSLKEVEAMSDCSSDHDESNKTAIVKLECLESTGYVPKCFIQNIPDHLCCSCCSSFCCDSPWVQIEPA